MEEQWKQVKKFPNYCVSSLGNIKGTSGKKFKLLTRGGGYLYKDFYEQGHKKRISIHRLVAKLFIPNPENKPDVNHKNGIKTDNRAENLEWVTKSENMIHAVILGLHNHTKLFDKTEVYVIKEAISIFSIRKVAGYFKVHVATISEIKNNKTYQ